MKTMSVIFGILSMLILVVELQFFFDHFDQSFVFDVMFDVSGYPFFV